MKNIKKIAKTIISYSKTEMQILSAHNMLHDALQQAANDTGEPSTNTLVKKAQVEIKKNVDRIIKELKSWED